MKTNHSPFLLLILDGWGHSEEKEHNAILAANTPNWDYFCEHYPHTCIAGSGASVGLPDGQMGNSEVGHLNLGAGRVVHQNIQRIDQAITDGDFFNNPILCDALEQAKQQKKAVHILGLVSPGGVHSHERHIAAMIKMAADQEIKQVYCHAFLDGRDMPPRSACASLAYLETIFQQTGCGRIASVIGRFYAMDRDQRWDRIEKAYQLICSAQADYQAASAQAALEQAYARDENDEFVQATVIADENNPAVKINPGDIVIFMNFRADRARLLSRALTEKEFSHFDRKPAELGDFITLTEYDTKLAADVVFPSIPLDNVLGDYLAKLNYKQLRIAETEKYAHVTFFFNGGVEEPFPGEQRLLIPSPKVETYDLQPEMNAFEMTEQLIDKIKSTQFDVVIGNFANPDMVGHTGNFDATVKAIEAVDTCLGKIYQALKEMGGELLITADHGNAEKMFNPESQQAHTSHTCQPVPLLYLGRPGRFIIDDGKLSDIAPTLLHLMGVNIPEEMTGRVLLQLDEASACED